MSSDSSQPQQRSQQAITVLSAPHLLGWISRGVDVLMRSRDDINKMNVFPVPDSDTGSNMLATIVSARDAGTEAAAKSDNVRDITAAIAAGAVRGARGNSGTVLSQVFRALAEAAAADGIGAPAIRHALKLAVRHVATAIANPVEGTILTVLRHSALAAEEFGDDDIVGLAQHMAAAARDALGKTPTQLRELRDAGVVDAGGTGLVLLLDALVDELTGVATSSSELHLHIENEQGPEMEVMYLIGPAEDAAIAALRSRLEPLGNSLIVAGDAQGEQGTFMVHIHTYNPGAVIEAALDFGRPQGIRIEVLEAATATEDPTSPRALVAVVPDGPLAELYRSADVTVIAPTPPHNGDDADRDWANDVVTKLLAAMRKLRDHDEIVLLPNGQVSPDDLVHIELSSSASANSLTIVPTTTLAEGLAAVAVHDETLPLAVDAYAMSEAASGMRDAELVRAEGEAVDCIIGGAHVHTAPTIAEALTFTLRTMLKQQPGELITLLLGTGAPVSAAEEARAALAHDGYDVEIVAYAAAGIAPLFEIGVE